MADKPELHTVNVAIPFQTARLAKIAYNSLRVDPEPKRGGVTKELSVKNNVLHANFTATSAAPLRVAVHGLFENTILVSTAADCAGDCASDHSH